MNFTKQQIADACRQYGPLLANLPPGIDGTQLLWAISGNESSFGANCTPRHEPAYDVGGVYGNRPVIKPLLAKWGSAAACSYGPWQIMFCNAASGRDPEDFDDLRICAQDTVAYLNRLLYRWKPGYLAQIGECWNEGHEEGDPQGMPVESSSPAVEAYVKELAANYTVPMPQ